MTRDRTVLASGAAALLLPILLLGVPPMVAGVAMGAAAAAPCASASAWVRLPKPHVPVPPDVERSYTEMGTVAPLEQFRSVAASADAASALYAGGFYGVYRTVDCGVTWQRLPFSPRSPSLTPIVNALAVSANSTIYAAHETALLVSVDGGTIWQFVGGLNARGLAPSRVVPDLAYGIFRPVGVGGFFGIARSMDGGATWQRTRGDVSAGVVAADPDDPDTVYLGLLGCALDSPTGCARLSGRFEISHDAGATSILVITFPAPITGLTLSADGGRMWAATEDGALYASRDRGWTWAPVAGLPYTGHLVSIAASQLDPRLLFAITDAGDVWAYREAGGPGFPRTGDGSVDGGAGGAANGSSDDG